MKFQIAQWCDEAAIAFKGLIDPDVLPLYLTWLSSGVATLWKITGEDFITWLITRVESFPSGSREMVLDVIAGKNCKSIVRECMSHAKRVGINSIRFETHHSEKLAKKFMGGMGFNRVATVLRAEL